MCPDCTHTCLSPPHGLGSFPLTQTGNPVICIVSNTPESCQVPVESRWVALAPLDELAVEPCLHKVMAAHVAFAPTGERAG